MMTIVDQYPAIDVTRQYKYFLLKRTLSDNVLAIFLQVIGLMSSTLSPIPNPIWFAPGLATAMIFLRGYRVLPGIWLGCFIALSTPCATALTLQAVLLTWITRRFINPSLVFYRVNKFLLFCLCNAVLALITSLALIYLRHVSYSLWLQWSLAIFNGVLIAGIAWVTFDTFSMYGGKSFDSHMIWRKTIRWALIVGLLGNMIIYLKLMSASLSMMIVLQAGLGLGAVMALVYSLPPNPTPSLPYKKHMGEKGTQSSRP